ncbi:MAG TPA: NAD-dependent epimerase/dehydratase family protein, partial [Lacipirellulaceae bacterium]|nr:NAD-dependent epimerase/dehydratase family protein [Lacipirellulaceae bacterium]
MIARAHNSVPLPLLITGVAGVAGYNALHYFRERYPGQVVAIRQADNWPLSGAGIVACDAEDNDRLRALFDEYQFQSVLNCAGNCALRACELDSRLAWRTNVEGLINLLSIAVDHNVRLVHLSIDLVYSGDRLPP